MSKLWSRIGLALLSLALADGFLRAEPAASINDPAALAALIDHYVGAGYAAAKATPAPLADDAEFMRRAYLDLAGRIPRNSDVRKFLADKSPGKRTRLIADLLESPHYVNNMTRVWRALLLPQGNNPQVQALAPAMETWLRKRFTDNVSYDRMVRELLTANVVQTPAMQQAFNNGGPMDATGAAFFQANDLQKPREPRRRHVAAVSSALSWNAPSATITRSPNGAASNSGNTPPSSPASARKWRDNRTTTIKDSFRPPTPPIGTTSRCRERAP